MSGDQPRNFNVSSGCDGDTAMPDPDELNAFFATVGSRVAAEITVNGEEPQPVRPTRVCAGQFSLTPVTLPELSAAVKGMRNASSVGVDGVPLLAIKNGFPVLGPLLLRIVNASIVSGVVPSAWKTACVVPIFESGDN